MTKELFTTMLLNLGGVPMEEREEVLIAASLNAAVAKYREIHHHPESPTDELTSFVKEMASHLVKELTATRLAVDMSKAMEHLPSKTVQWYSIDYEGQVELHDSPDEARKSAQYTIDNALDDHWPENMERVEWGSMERFQSCHEQNRREKPSPDDPAAEEWPNNDWDFIVEYTLVNDVPSMTIHKDGVESPGARIAELEKAAKYALDELKEHIADEECAGPNGTARRGACHLCRPARYLAEVLGDK